MRDLSLSTVRKDRSPVIRATETGKKHQGECNDLGKQKKIRPSEEVFYQYASQTNGYDSEFERESQSVQSLNFDIRFKILTIIVKWTPLFTKTWLTLFTVISLLVYPKLLERK